MVYPLLSVEGPDGTTSIRLAPESVPRPAIFPGFFARITDATQDGSNKRWKYSFVEVIKASAGYTGWRDKDDGIEGSAVTGVFAFNGIEDQNGSSGLYGNGVESSDLTGTFDIQPVPDGTRVFIHSRFDFDGVAEYWFTYANGVTGDCP